MTSGGDELSARVKDLRHALGRRIGAVDWAQERTTFLISDAGRALERRVERLKEVTRALLKKDGKPFVFNHYGGGLSDMLEEIQHPLSRWREWVERDYKKCFDLTHIHGLDGGWLILLCDLARPLSDERPLLVDLLPETVELHPNIAELKPLSKLGDTNYLLEVKGLFGEAAAYIKTSFPYAFSMKVDRSSLYSIKDWERTQLNEHFRNAFEDSPPTLSRIHTSNRNAALVAIEIAITIYSVYTAAEYFMDKVYKIAQEKIEAEKRREQVAKEWKETFGKEQAAIEGASDHVDLFDRNKEVIGSLS